MLMTELQMQSSKMTCPIMTRTDVSAYCMGAQCPMWRWSGTHAKVYVHVNGQSTLLQSPETRQGFCGLAGKPLELG